MSPLAKSQEFLPQIHRPYQLDSYESHRELNSEDEEAKDDIQNKAMLDSYEDNELPQFSEESVPVLR